MLTLTTVVQHSVGSSSHSNEIGSKRYQTGREEVKLSLTADDMILHIENSEDATQHLL